MKTILLSSVAAFGLLLTACSSTKPAPAPAPAPATTTATKSKAHTTKAKVHHKAPAKKATDAAATEKAPKTPAAGETKAADPVQ